MKYLLILALCSVSFAQFNAPAGFRWGTMKRDYNYKYHNCTSESDYEICGSKKSPKKISFADNFWLLFDKKKGLHKVKIISVIDGDAYGTAALRLYKKLDTIFTQKYGEGKSVQYINYKVYKESDEFFECLAYEGCGYWAGYWQPKDGGTVSINIAGERRGQGYVEVIYESPLWSDIVDGWKKKKLKSDYEGL